MNNPEISEIELSDNCLSKLPNQIQFEESINTLGTIKSISELNIDLINSNEAMLVLNKLPIIHGRSTKEEDKMTQKRMKRATIIIVMIRIIICVSE